MSGDASPGKMLRSFLRGGGSVAAFEPEIVVMMFISPDKGKILFQVRRGYKITWAHTEPYSKETFRADVTPYLATQLAETEKLLGIAAPRARRPKPQPITPTEVQPEPSESQSSEDTTTKRQLPKKGGA